MINHLSISYLNEKQFLDMSSEDLVRIVKQDAGFEDRTLSVYEIDSKPARINTIFKDCAFRVMSSQNLSDSQKVQKFWDLVGIFNGIDEDCFNLAQKK